MSSDYSAILAVARKAALEAGAMMKVARDREEFQVEFKDVNNLVTSADLEADRIICSHIRNAFPDHRILAEESAPSLTSAELEEGGLWIIDPIDGTTNFAHGHFQVGVSIAYAERGTVQVAVVYAPYVDELFHAVRGGGSFLNDRRLRGARASSIAQALIATGFPYERADIGPVMQRLERVLRRCRDIRRIGAASLDISWVACGRLDAFFEPLMPWDIAAGALIAREAGLITGQFIDDPFMNGLGPLPGDLRSNYFMVAPPVFYEQLRRLIVGE